LVLQTDARELAHAKINRPFVWVAALLVGSESVPIAFAPSCFTNTGTPAVWHCRTIDRAHATSNARDCGPLSPPTITHDSRR
jgi:hypothetical protein